MVTVELTEDEAALLKRCLELMLSDLRMEISHTDSADFRTGLKTEKAVLERVLAQLGPGE